MRFSFYLFLLTFSLGSFALFEEDSVLKTITDMTFFKSLKDGASDHLIMLFFYKKDCPKCNAIKSQIVDVAESLDGILESYHVNCNKIRKLQNNLAENQKVLLCEEKYEEQLPQIMFLAPPEMKINPYTQKPMKAIEHPYQGEGSASAIKDFAKKQIPAFRKIIKTQAELDEFLSFHELPNKVILFTDKKETSVMYKGMTSIYRDRIDFAEINADSEELTTKYDITDYPTLMVLQLADSGEYTQIVYEDSIKFEKVKQFLNTFALEEKVSRVQKKKKEEKPTPKEEEKQSSKAVELAIRKYQKQILDQEKMVLLYVYGPNESNQKQFNEIQQRFGDMLLYYTFELDSDSKKTFAEEKLFVKKTPILKLFPLGTNKKERSKIFFDDDITTDELKSEINDIVEDQSRGFSSMKEFQQYLLGTFQEEKIPIIMLHNQKETSISWRVSTHLTEFTDKINFFTVQNPSQEIADAFTAKKLPAMVGLFQTPPEENADPSQKQQPNLKVAAFSGKFVFNEMSMFFNQILGNDPQKPQYQQHSSSPAKQVHQLQTQEDFEKYCTRRSQMCFIGFFDLSDNDPTKLQSWKESLEEVTEKFSERKVEFMWIDGACHNYLLDRVNLQEDYLPQLIYYNPSKNQYSNQIGTFDTATLHRFAENVLKGRVQMNKVSEEIDIDDRNCEQFYVQRKERIQKLEENNDLDDEILKEILEEEREKKRMEEEEQSQRKKNKKNKKKKGKKAKKEDL